MNRNLLGFGLMRLPELGGEVDIEQTKKMTDYFLENGFDYFDTAYVYGKSEDAVKTVLTDRHPRESFRLATKLPVWMAPNRAEMKRLFDKQLTRTGAGYFDYYLLHAMVKDRASECDENGAWEFVLDLKKQGLVKNVGFSFHDKPDVLDDILTKHPEMDFVQLQINYIDWEDHAIEARLSYEVARKHNKPIIIMEPVKGGSLVQIKPEIQEIFRAANPAVSVASWALRYAASLEGIEMVLSGMSSMEQTIDNVNTMKNFEPLSREEHNVILRVVAALENLPSIPCTMCGYCLDNCPQKVKIPEIFLYLNLFKVYGNYNEARENYKRITASGGRASDCIECGCCETHCPQHINIIECLKECAEVLEAKQN